MTVVCGIDGCRGGWVVVTARVRPWRVLAVDVVSRLDAALAGPAEFIAIDMPIGLARHGPRACDQLARSMLGARRSSVFPAPVRAVLDAEDYPDALRRSRAASGVGLSKQTWHLVPKIIELDSLMTPALQPRVREAHPELAFARLGGAPMSTHKSAPAGRAERVAVIGEPPVATGGLTGTAHGARAGADDLLDALVLAHVAADMITGDAIVVGDGSRDERGLVMEIWG